MVMRFMAAIKKEKTSQDIATDNLNSDHGIEFFLETFLRSFIQWISQSNST